MTTDSGYFDVPAFARGEQCEIVSTYPDESEFVRGWQAPNVDHFPAAPGRLTASPYNAWMDVRWQDEHFTVLTLHWEFGGQQIARYWLLADTEDLAQQFFLVVCDWNAEIRGEILVFDDGCWQKDEELYQSIATTTFENLILPEALKEQIVADLEQFFAAREMYERYHIPWKRGILFIGTPGNGKTHTIKALINALKRPCLYVKSFKAEYMTDARNISDVFRRARTAAPCLLVLEDLDALLTDENRAFFLNELDGFAVNTGIVVLASTNHPDHLDAAVLERPSRFDRKYHFELPMEAERSAYLTHWNATFEPPMRMSNNAIATLASMTHGFSFAYLKELVLAALMRWATAQEEDLATLMSNQVEALRRQMAHPAAAPGHLQ
jgi:AAA+ superfamily predicted ATPase